MCSIKRYDLRETRRDNGICTTSSYAIELWEVGKFVKYLDYKKLDADNKRYREALEAIKKHQETMNQGDGPLKNKKLYEFTAAWNMAQKALDGDND